MALVGRAAESCLQADGNSCGNWNLASLVNYAGENGIEPNGCFYLAQDHWRNLHC
jgi:hypothetical protein